jgi:hypothetical protein
MPDSDFLAALRALYEGGVEFAVVGGLAAVLNGAPVNTFDLDIVPARDEANVARLLRVLDRLDGIYRMQPDRRLKPDASHLSSPGHHNLITNCGPLDVLGTIGRGLGYADCPRIRPETCGCRMPRIAPAFACVSPRRSIRISG